MGYKDPEKQRSYQREYMRLYRQDRKAGKERCKTPVQLFEEKESAFRIKTAGDILELLAETIRQVRALEPEGIGETIQQAKCIGYLAQIALRAVETSNLEGRIEALETVLIARKEHVA